MKRVARHPRRHGTSTILLSVLVSLMTGCGLGSQDSHAGATDAVSVDMPSIYVAQTVVFKEDGEASTETSYRQLLQACRDAAMSTTPLSEGNTRKLGRTYFQLWFDDKHSAWQKDAWDFGSGEEPSEMCHFYMKHEAYKVVFTAEEQLSIDLMAGTVISEESPGFASGGPQDPQDDEQFDRDTAKQLGIERLGYASDAGQRCLRWRMPKPNDDESCTWSEGRKWGFPEGDGSGQASSYDPGKIVLWVHPAYNLGFELTTQKMTVGGQSFDKAVFLAPVGIDVKRKGP